MDSGMTEHEALFWSGHVGDGVPDADAIRQYRRYASKGLYPTDPHPDFLALLTGKKGHYLAKKELRDGWMNGTDAWPGMDYLRRTCSEWRLRFLLDWRAF